MYIPYICRGCDKILCLEWEWNPHLWHSRPVCYHSPHRIPDLTTYTHVYLSMQLLASEVSADSYTHPPEIVRLLMLTITYIQTVSCLTYIYMYVGIYRVGSTTTQHIACPGSWSWNQCHGCDENGKYCA